MRTRLLGVVLITTVYVVVAFSAISLVKSVGLTHTFITGEKKKRHMI